MLAVGVMLMRLAKVRLMKKTMTMLLMRLVKGGLMKTTNRL